MMRDASLSGRPFTHSACVIAALCPLAFFQDASADESGVSFWLQGQFGSFAAVPANPGWSFESTFYHATAGTDASRSFARGGGIQAGMKSPSDFVMVTPTYVFATPVLGGQAAVSMTSVYGRNTTSVAATLAGPGGATLSGNRSDYVIGFGDFPELSAWGRRSGFSFPSRTGTDTSISGAIPNSTPGTGSKGGPRTSRSLSKRRNGSQKS
jgi:hypothetical protein